MAKLIAILTLFAATGIVFYKTIVTREWRNQAPGETKSWRWWVVYFNRQDSRLFLPKRSGLGWTINFAQPLAIVLLLLLLVALIAGRMALSPR